MSDTLLIFIKNPQLGKAKTRIAKTLGDEAALQIYKDLLTEVKSITEATNVHRQLWYSSFIDAADQWDSELFDKKLQYQGDLGERMSHAFKTAFAEGAKSVIIIGSDCPFITPESIQFAFEGLKKHDAVIGPTFDGGYYLLGMRSFHPKLFKNIEWSTDSVFESTCSIFEAEKLSYCVLEKLRDLDYAEDLKHWRS